MNGQLVTAAAVLADSDKGKGSPIGILVIILLIIAVYFLYRSMSRHVKKVPTSFDKPPAGGDQQSDGDEAGDAGGDPAPLGKTIRDESDHPTPGGQ